MKFLASIGTLALILLWTCLVANSNSAIFITAWLAWVFSLSYIWDQK